jgi:threonine-phosphate decarboxylase
METTMTAHGGDVWRVAGDLNIPVSELLDFSANVNPRGLPPRALDRLLRDAADPKLLGLYPDRSASTLKNALSDRLGVPAEAIVVGPGAEALLAPALRSLKILRALVPVPAFSEYRRVCEQESVEYVAFPLNRSEDFRVPVDRLCQSIETEASAGVVFLNNPHNPSGTLLEACEVGNILDAANSAGATLLLDEAFIDYTAHYSLVEEAARHPGLIVLRSLTKFYGCPALRVGYAVAHPETIRLIAAFLPTWPVTQLALDALTEAVADRQYAEATLNETASNRKKLRESLESLQLKVFPSAANYLLIELCAGMPKACELRRRMARNHQILIRNCDSYEALTHGRYIRVAVRSASDNLRLIDALAKELRPQ